MLSIIVWDHPELTNPTGEFRDPESSGRLVGADGHIFYPYVGELKVSGLTVSTIRRLIAARLARVVKDPQVDVRVAAFRSQTVEVTGSVSQPKVVSISDQGLSISEAIVQAGGILESASRRYVYLTRGGETIRLDRGLRQTGYSNGLRVQLRNGDKLYVPNSEEYPVYLFGGVARQAALPLVDGEISLAEALGKIGGLDELSANGSKIYVIRDGSYPGTSSSNFSADIQVELAPEVYSINLNDVSALLMSERFFLLPRDIVYIDRTGLSTVNSVFAQILPAISTIFQLDRLVDN